MAFYIFFIFFGLQLFTVIFNSENKGDVLDPDGANGFILLFGAFISIIFFILNLFTVIYFAKMQKALVEILDHMYHMNKQRIFVFSVIVGFCMLLTLFKYQVFHSLSYLLSRAT